MNICRREDLLSQKCLEDSVIQQKFSILLEVFANYGLETVSNENSSIESKFHMGIRFEHYFGVCQDAFILKLL